MEKLIRTFASPDFAGNPNLRWPLPSSTGFADRRASLDQIAQGGSAEYFDPFSGAPLGSIEQSWTAAVALVWLVAKNLQSVNMDAA